MKSYRSNPRAITERALTRLRKSLDALGDLGGIVENVAGDDIAPNTGGQVVGGHQRLRAMFGESAGEFSVSDADIEIVHKYAEPTKQGTVAEGFIVWRGGRYAYRRVVWDDETFRRANFAANVQAGEWNWDEFANIISAQDLANWGFDVAEWSRTASADAAALKEMIASEGEETGEERKKLSREEKRYIYEIETTYEQKQVIDAALAMGADGASLLEIGASEVLKNGLRTT